VATPAHDAQLLERTVFEVKRIIVGQDRLVERMLVGLLAKGHLLLEGVPGVAKTLAVETFARVVGGSFSRVQFTPDLVPADILGTRIYRQAQEHFDVELGPVVANFVLADEINRAPAKVQSAMLEVMAERHVSIGGQTFRMPDPFLVLATQNPIENEGVYPLPEAQRDRFLFKILVEYPTAEEEREIVYRMGVSPPEPHEVLSPDELVRLQNVASQVFVHHALVDYVVRLVLATRTPQEHGLADVAGMTSRTFARCFRQDWHHATPVVDPTAPARSAAPPRGHRRPGGPHRARHRLRHPGVAPTPLPAGHGNQPVQLPAAI
jgi:MoxR-like ATPase